MSDKRIHRHVFNGNLYDIDLRPRYGCCDNPEKCSPTFFIDWYNITDKLAMEVAIHEGLHACNYSKSEEEVDQTAKDIARFLWRLGFR